MWVPPPFPVIRSGREDEVIILSQHDRSDTVLLQFVCKGPAGCRLAAARFPRDRDRVPRALPSDRINNAWNNLARRSSMAFLDHNDIASHSGLPSPALAGRSSERMRAWRPRPLRRRGRCPAAATLALRGFALPPSVARSGDKPLLTIGRLKPEKGVGCEFPFLPQGNDGG